MHTWDLLDYDIFLVCSWWTDDGGARLPELFEGVGFLQEDLPDVTDLEQRIDQLVEHGVLERQGDRLHPSEHAWAAALRSRAASNSRDSRSRRRIGVRLLTLPTLGASSMQPM
jgi:hypothetical protein